MLSDNYLLLIIELELYTGKSPYMHKCICIGYLMSNACAANFWIRSPRRCCCCAPALVVVSCILINLMQSCWCDVSMNADKDNLWPPSTTYRQLSKLTSYVKMCKGAWLLWQLTRYSTTFGFATNVSCANETRRFLASTSIHQSTAFTLPLSRDKEMNPAKGFWSFSS